jgi:hypothetical protein
MLVCTACSIMLPEQLEPLQSCFRRRLLSTLTNMHCTSKQATERSHELSLQEE